MSYITYVILIVPNVDILPNYIFIIFCVECCDLNCTNRFKCSIPLMYI